MVVEGGLVDEPVDDPDASLAFVICRELLGKTITIVREKSRAQFEDPLGFVKAADRRGIGIDVISREEDARIFGGAG